MFQKLNLSRCLSVSGLLMLFLVCGCNQSSEEKPNEIVTPISPEEALARLHTVNNLKQLVLGLQYFHNDNTFFPPADGAKVQVFNFPNTEGLSWRTYAVQFTENEANKPKDVEFISKWLSGREASPNPAERWNVPQIKEMVFHPVSCPMRGKTQEPWHTFYRVFIGPGAAFEKGKLFSMDKERKEFPDGLENTLMIVEASVAVPWTKPEELEYDPAKPLPKLGGLFADGFYAAFADGEVRFIAKDTPEKSIRAWITRNGGETVTLPPIADTKALRKAAKLD